MHDLWDGAQDVRADNAVRIAKYRVQQVCGACVAHALNCPVSVVHLHRGRRRVAVCKQKQLCQTADGRVQSIATTGRQDNFVTTPPAAIAAWCQAMECQQAFVAKRTAIAVLTLQAQKSAFICAFGQGQRRVNRVREHAWIRDCVEGTRRAQNDRHPAAQRKCTEVLKVDAPVDFVWAIIPVTARRACGCVLRRRSNAMIGVIVDSVVAVR
mmetsp:Transcript_4008/g.12710  ORF Transcript_4008/g.12710 Transcript_4008/m.12710 type:complete len:211 (-) Transcript_4008:415-1047(-)